MSKPLRRPESQAARIQARADKGRAWQEIQELWEKGEKARAEYERRPNAACAVKDCPNLTRDNKGGYCGGHRALVHKPKTKEA